MSTDAAGGFLTEDDTELLNGLTETEFSISTEAFDVEELSGGEEVNREGWYHFEVADVEVNLDTLDHDGNERTPSILFKMTVLHSVKGQSPAGWRLYHRLYVGQRGGGPPKEGSVKSMIRFGLGLGLLKQVNQGGKRVAVDAESGQPSLAPSMWLRGKGRQCIGQVKKEIDRSGLNDPRFQLPYGKVYALDDEGVAHIEKNAEAMKLVVGAVAPAPAEAATAHVSGTADGQWGLNDL